METSKSLGDQIMLLNKPKTKELRMEENSRRV